MLAGIDQGKSWGFANGKTRGRVALSTETGLNHDGSFGFLKAKALTAPNFAVSMNEDIDVFGPKGLAA